MPTEAQQRAKKKYLAGVNRVLLEFPPSDAELWEHLQKQDKKQTYIKALIRADIEKKK